MAQAPQWLHDILHEYSTDLLSIFFDGFKHNHMADGIISLWHIGATEERIRKYAEDDKRHLEPAEELEALESKLSEQELKNLLGQRKRYLHLVQHYMFVSQDLEGNLDLLINQEFPKLAPGLGSSAVHGLIHIGYGYSVRNERTVCEGLALTHCDYVAHEVTDLETFVNELGRGQTDILDVIKDVRKDQSHLGFLQEGGLPGFGTFSGRYLKLLVERGDLYAHLASSIRFPEWFDREADLKQQVPRLCQWVLDSCIAVYTMSEQKNDFFILHGVTGAWGLTQVLPLLQADPDILQTLLYFLSALLAVYITQGTPELLQENIGAALSDDEALTDWEQLKERAVVLPTNTHAYKLVHVCWERTQENSSTNPHMEQLYKAAANIVLNKPYSFD